MFSPAETFNLVQQSLNQDVAIPEGHKGAVVVIADTTKVQIVTAVKVNDHWAINGVVEHTWAGQNTAGVISKFTW